VLCGVPTPPGFSARCGIIACSLPLPHAPSAAALLPHPTHLRRVLSLRCALAHFLLQLAADPRAPVLFRCTTPAAGSGLDVAGLMPTLFLLKDALMQVSNGDGGVFLFCFRFCDGRGWHHLFLLKGALMQVRLASLQCG